MVSINFEEVWVWVAVVAWVSFVNFTLNALCISSHPHSTSQSYHTHHADITTITTTTTAECFSVDCCCRAGHACDQWFATEQRVWQLRSLPGWVPGGRWHRCVRGCHKEQPQWAVRNERMTTSDECITAWHAHIQCIFTTLNPSDMAHLYYLFGLKLFIPSFLKDSYSYWLRVRVRVRVHVCVLMSRSRVAKLEYEAYHKMAIRQFQSHFFCYLSLISFHFIHSFIHSFVRSFVHSFVRSFIHQSINPSTNNCSHSLYFISYHIISYRVAVVVVNVVCCL